MRDAGCFGHAVTFADGDADALEEFEDLVRDGRRTRETEPHPIESESLLELPEDREV